jgi:DnaJ family protein B protein 12
MDYIVFSATFGPGGFRTTRVNRGQAAQPQEPRSMFMQLLPLIILLAFSFIGSLSSLSSFFSTPNPDYSFQQTRTYSDERITSGLQVPYFVNPRQFNSHPIYESIPENFRASKTAGTSSAKLYGFEREVEKTFVSAHRHQCNKELEDKERRMDAHRGLFGLGADWDKIKLIQKEPMPSCEKLRSMGLLGY